MQVFLTFDYELFFGDKPGTVQKCMLEPTDALLALAEKYGIPMTFFIDIGFLLRLEEAKSMYPELEQVYQAILAQFERMKNAGCDLQLHIHPHWEKSTYSLGKWHVNTAGCYKLSDFKPNEIDHIVRKYYVGLSRISGKKPTAFRAGGWCVQPFHLIEKTFQELGIKYDSSVFPGGKFTSNHYAFDFTQVPRFSDAYRFQSDVCVSDASGNFMEIPIASWNYSPSFYWRLYILGRLFPEQHKMIGDGNFVAQPGRKQRVLTNFTWNHVSSDGYYASMLLKQARAYRNKNCGSFVVIGHPKGMTQFSLRALDKFIEKISGSVTFVNFESCVG